MFHFLTVLTRSGEGIPSQRVSSTRRKVLFIPKSLENAERVSQMPGCRWAVGESAAIKGKNKIQTLHGKALIRAVFIHPAEKNKDIILQAQHLPGRAPSRRAIRLVSITDVGFAWTSRSLPAPRSIVLHSVHRTHTCKFVSLLIC